jgi:hypothetical protein
MQLEEISIPRLRKFSKRIDDSCSQQHVALSAEDHFRVVYFKVIDSAVVQLTDRFNQSGIEKVISLEQALLGRMDDLHFQSCYPELDVYRLDVQLRMFRLSNTFSNVEEAAELIAKLPRECRTLFSQVETLVRFLLVMPASSAEAERSFSSLRRLKTWLRSTMTQPRLNHVCILNIHQDVLDSIDLQDIANQFISKNVYRKQIFGSA